MKAIRLRTEYLNNPLGVDFKAPRLSWNCAGGVKQTAYQIVCQGEDGRTLWDSGKKESGAMHAVYQGRALPSRARVRWQVRLWDEKDMPSEFSETACFERGLDGTDWQAKWITGNYKVNKKQRYPVDCFCKIFHAGNIKKARMYATACGLYSARLNGETVEGFKLAPGHTDYRKRVQYQTYDVTEFLQNGENILEFQLADGWYRGSCGAWGLKNQYGTETKLLAQLEITLEDNTRMTVATDDTWDWSSDGPICFADNKDGEIVEAWRAASYTGKALATSHSVVPSASNNVPVTEHEHFAPTVITTPTGKTVLDFGQNIAGYVSFTLQAKEGQRIFLRFGEMLGKDGEFTQANIQCANKKITTPLQQVEYFCKEGENHYKTSFAVFGFRYALVETDVPFAPENFTAIAVYSDLEQTARFESSNELLNKFVKATVWSAKGNYADVPTDCPTRERHGWSGDAQIFFETAAYLFDFAPFAKKHLNDMYDWQRKDGCLPQIAPAGGVDSYMDTMNGSVGWADAGILIPYHYWKIYGDARVLVKYYEGMKRYAEFMIRRCGKRGFMAKKITLSEKAKPYLVNAGQSYGEWAEPADVHPNHWTNMVAPHPEVSTAYTAYVLGIMAEIAEVLGQPQDQARFVQYSEGCKKAYQEMVELPEFSLDTDRQAQLVRPLAFNLLNGEQTEFAKHRLIEALEHYDWRLGTGFLSTPLILKVLADIDIEAAYRLLENEEMPGWLYMPKNGATTIWESWEGTEAQGGIASLNHYSKGAVCTWLFKNMCGIQMAGDNHFVIAPQPGGNFTHAKTEYQSVYGSVTSGWEKTDDGYTLNVIIPANTTAEIILPNGQRPEVTAGTHTFTW